MRSSCVAASAESAAARRGRARQRSLAAGRGASASWRGGEPGAPSGSARCLFGTRTASGASPEGPSPSPTA